MAYFTAAVARDGQAWKVVDVDLEAVDGLAALASRMRADGVGDEPVVLLVEREDEWFAVVRVDGEDDPRVFVSDVSAALSTRVGQMLGVEPGEMDGEEPYGGDVDLLDDLGTPAEALEQMCGDDGLLPGDAINAIAETAGFVDLVDALR